MSSQFQVDLDACSTIEGDYEARPRLGPDQSGHASEFADGVRRLLGDDSEPDPLFFEESWSVGVSAALENWCQRQQSLANRECGGRALQQLDNLGSLVFMQRSEWNMNYFLSAHAAVIAGRHDAGGPRWAPQEPDARTGNQRTQERATPADECDSSQATINPTTELRACRILGVTAASTREQVRSAYRRLVGQWHPDRLYRGTQEERRVATEQMAAINEAYQLIHGGPSQEPRFAQTA